MDDLIVHGGMVAGQQQDIAIQQGRIRAIAPGLHTAAREQLRGDWQADTPRVCRVTYPS